MARDRGDNVLNLVVSKHDTPCGRCGFNLRGVDLERGGVCPECGLEVTFQSLLRGGSPEEVRRGFAVRRRVTRLGWALLVILLGVLVVVGLRPRWFV